MTSTSLPPPPPATFVEVIYPAGRGSIGLRGSHAPLSWEHTHSDAAERDGDRVVFRIEVPPGELLELKLVRNEEEWAAGRNYLVHAGDHLRLEPHFDTQSSTLEANQTLEVGGAINTLVYDVLLPPSYGEQEGKRYPVLYVQDGQSLWAHSSDPFGVWKLETILDSLYDLEAIEEVIVVGIHAADGRIEKLSPVKDDENGGGDGPAFLDAIVDRLRDAINTKYRTKTERENTVILGSSMGGLFAFFAAWARPEVFGKAICLSSSFWWANRWAVRTAQNKPPKVRPIVYMDSGAAINPLDKDMNARDGFHHTRSMFRAMTSHGFTPGVDLHRLVFSGHTHDADSWSARVAIPLQLMFPRS
jgi:predicted alpha/beta superfamily hydrolase